MPSNKRPLILLTAILSLVACALFTIAYWIGHHAAFIAVAAIFLIVSFLAFVRWRAPSAT
jgi:hypothetical protein